MNAADDGQHQHGRIDKASPDTFGVDDAALASLERHVKVCKQAPAMIYGLEISFFIDFDEKEIGVGTLVCGYCEQSICPCKVSGKGQFRITTDD